MRKRYVLPGTMKSVALANPGEQQPMPLLLDRPSNVRDRLRRTESQEEKVRLAVCSESGGQLGSCVHFAEGVAVL